MGTMPARSSASPARLELTPVAIALCAGYFLVLLDVTLVNVALPRIGTDLRAGPSALAWVVDGYAVPLAALLLVSGTLGDRIGHRRMVLAGFALFALASVACALAPGIGSLVAARVVQGVGAALMLPGTLALLVAPAPSERVRTRLVALWAAIGGAALPSGPVIGGAIVQWLGWRATFWLPVPIIVLALVGVLVGAAPSHVGGRSPIDWPGAGLMVLTLATTVLALTRVRDHPLQAAGLLALSALCGAALSRVEQVSERPLLAVPRAARRPLLVACAVAAVMNLCTLGGLFVLTQWLQHVAQVDPLHAGLTTIAVMLPAPLVATPSGRLIERIGVWRTSAIALTIGAVGLAGTGWCLAGGHRLALLSGLVLWGLGIGLLAPAVVTAALHSLPAAPGVASGASNTARQMAGAVGVALFGALAGAPGPLFGYRAGWLFAAAALVFALAALACVRWSSRARAVR